MTPEIVEVARFALFRGGLVCQKNAVDPEGSDKGWCDAGSAFGVPAALRTAPGEDGDGWKKRRAGLWKGGNRAGGPQGPIEATKAS